MPLIEMQQRHAHGFYGVLFSLFGVAMTLYGGVRIYGTGIKRSWETTDPAWLAVFMGAIFCLFGGMFIWDRFFARDLTPEETRMREMREDVQEERNALFGTMSDHRKD